MFASSLPQFLFAVAAPGVDPHPAMILPFAVLYVLPYSVGIVPNAYMKMSVMSLALVPLTLAYAIIRYRLMDVDILFRRGYAYTLATLCVLAGFYGIVFSLASLAQKNGKLYMSEPEAGQRSATATAAAQAISCLTLQGGAEPTSA